MSIPRTPAPTQCVVNHCGCGQKGMAVVKHYDIVQCNKCGVFWWALQPKRGGLLEAWPWPGGRNLIAVELKEKEAK